MAVLDDSWALSQATTPNVEPVPTSDAKDHLRVDSTAENTLIDGLVHTARIEAEHITRRQFVQATWDLQLDAFPSTGREIPLPRPPLQSVTSVQYTTTDGTTGNSFGSSNYVVDTKSEPGRIVLKQDAEWPDDDLQAAAGVNIRFVAGYSTNATGVPKPIRHAIKLLAGHWFENREPVLIGERVEPLPMAVNALLAPYRIHSFW